ncbi:MAG: tetratricopeptide repeat protein [Lachnospiraceae bacterium]|nr:tetratricopeptide repeat protein [Lachnospiraceae bacterium]
MLEFLKKNYLFTIWLVAFLVLTFLKVSFGWIFLGTLVYLLLVLLLRLPRTVFTLGYLLQGGGKEATSRKMYEWAYKKGARVGAPMIAYGMMLLKNSEYPEGLKVLQDVLLVPKLNPNFLKVVRQDLSIAYYKNGDLETAISTLELMLEEYEFFSGDFYTTLGYFYIEAGDYEKAREINERALKEDASCGAAYDNLALIEYEQGRPEEAEELFLKALELKDTMVSSKYYLGLIAEQKGDADAAADYFTAAHGGTITGLNTITREQVDAKYDEYCLKG